MDRTVSAIEKRNLSFADGQISWNTELIGRTTAKLIYNVSPWIEETLEEVDTSRLSFVWSWVLPRLRLKLVKKESPDCSYCLGVTDI